MDTMIGAMNCSFFKMVFGEFLEKIFRRLRLSARAYHKMIKTARTIADMEGSEEITILHLSEAVCYRSIDYKFQEKEM